MIPVFLASDESYAKYMAVTIQSILSNTDTPIHFCILDGGIYPETKEKLATLTHNTSHTMEFITVDLSLFNKFPDIRHFSLNTYFRYLIPLLKPDISKALYIDTDILVQGDISTLFHKSLNGYGIGAVAYMDELYAPKTYLNYKKNLGLKKEHHYFNAGVLLIDCDYWRKNNITDVLLQTTHTFKNKLKMPDQDVLNIVFHTAYSKLPSQYNLVVDLTARYHDFKKYTSELSGCLLFHYTGGNDIRPWMNKNTPNADLFWKHAKNTPFYHELQIDLITNQAHLILKKIDRIYPKSSVTNITLFDLIPLIKIKQKQGKIRVFLFGFLPILKIKKNG